MSDVDKDGLEPLEEEQRQVWTHIDADMSRRLSSKRCFCISINKILIAALKNVWQPETNPAVMVDEENWELKRGVFDVSANVYFIGRGPSTLGNDGPLSPPDAEVQQPWCIWEWWLEIGYIWHHTPCPLGIPYVIVLQEVRDFEQDREEVVRVMRREHIGKKPIHKDVVWS